MRNGEINRKIIEVAAYLFSLNGYSNVTIDEIAKVSRKSKGTIYYHFKSKEAIFVEVISAEINFIKSSLAQIPAMPNVPADIKLKRFLLHRLFLINESKNYKEALKNDLFEQFEPLKKVRAEFDQWITNQYYTILQFGFEEGLFIEMKRSSQFIELYVLMQKGLEKPFFINQKYDDYIFQYEEIISLIVKALKKPTQILEMM